MSLDHCLIEKELKQWLESLSINLQMRPKARKQCAVINFNFQNLNLASLGGFILNAIFLYTYKNVSGFVNNSKCKCHSKSKQTHTIEIMII